MTDDRRKLEQRLKRAIIAALDPADRGLALQPRYRRLHELGCDPTTGFCSIAAEALWAMLGGRAAGYELVQVSHEGGPHWFVRFMPTGRVIDPTRAQFSTTPPYHLGRAQSTGAKHGTGYKHLGRRDLLVSQRAHRLIDLVMERAAMVLLRKPPRRNPSRGWRDAVLPVLFLLPLIPP